MKRLFTTDCLHIGLARMNDEKIRLDINSDFSGSSRKSRLWVDEKRLATEVEDTWRSIKTRKLQDFRLYFDEIDYYDNMTDVYETPVISMSRGQRKCRISSREHGSIPKDWSVNVVAVFEDTRTKGPIVEVIKQVLGTHFDTELEKNLAKNMTAFLQKKVKSFYVSKD